MPTEKPPVLRLADIERGELADLLARFDLELIDCAEHEPIPGSYWGDDEAGLKANRLHARADTPLHSIVHEACHYICLSPARRRSLDTDAGSDETEENAVCYLQVLLAGELAGLGRERMFADMDAWGYSFRLGCSRAWFENDAEDARQWLLEHRLIDNQARLCWCLRGAGPRPGGHPSRRTTRAQQDAYQA
jgi:hypothetical protein